MEIKIAQQRHIANITFDEEPGTLWLFTLRVFFEDKSRKARLYVFVSDKSIEGLLPSENCTINRKLVQKTERAKRLAQNFITSYNANSEESERFNAMRFIGECDNTKTVFSRCLQHN